MKLGNLKIYIYIFVLFLGSFTSILAADKIQSVPLINLEDLSPTFEEDKDILESNEEENSNFENDENIIKKKLTKKKR